MTTHRCRCPICATLTEQGRPKRASWVSRIDLILVTLAVLLAVVDAFGNKYAEAAYLMSLATFMVVTRK